MRALLRELSRALREQEKARINAVSGDSDLLRIAREAAGADQADSQAGDIRRSL
ncbi:MAG: hypothetical protein ACREVY_06105 [Gammaproteobacteria bacterium]